MGKYLPSILLVVLMGACNPKTSTSNSNVSLVGTSWQLNHAGDITYEPKPGVRKVAMTFENSNKLTGFLGCNNLGGAYSTYKRNGIKFTAASTKMACPDMSIENKFSEALNAARHYKLDGKRLALFDDRGFLLADFIALN